MDNVWQFPARSRDDSSRARESRRYSSENAQLLADDLGSNAAQAELGRLKNQGRYLRCPCGRELHVHTSKSGSLFLQRNPGQTEVPAEANCALCASDWRTRETRGRKGRRPEGGQATMGLILRTRTPAGGTRGTGAGGVRGSGGGRGGGQHKPSIFGVVWTLLDESRLLGLSGALTPVQIWRRVYDVLDRTPLDASVADHPVLSSISWVPSGIVKGGLSELNSRLSKGWTHPRYRAEVWTFGIISELTPSEEEETTVVIPNGSYQVRIQVPSQSISAVGTSGPYFALAVGSPDSNTMYPIYHRLALQAVARPDCPVPVESGHERDVVALLQELGIPFVKPVFEDDQGFRPDFVLHRHRAVLEVQGLNTEAYRERKGRRLRELEDAVRERRRTLLTYDPNDGETIEDLRAKLDEFLPQKRT